MSEPTRIPISGISKRQPEYEIEPLFLMRWSPRAMNGEILSENELMRLFEASRWAPSSFNEQEWRFLYARRDTPEWETFFNLLVDANKTWCKDAAVLVVVVGAKNFAKNGKANKVHSFDCGAAFQNLALQATSMNIVAHGMAGFDFDKAKSSLNVPDDFEVQAMIALGKPAPKDTLPKELQDKEEPSQRRPVKLSVCEGSFSF